MRAPVILAVVAAAALATSACTASGADKGGAPETTSLTIAYSDPTANSNNQTYGGPAFMDSLRRLFGSTLELNEAPNYGHDTGYGDLALIKAVAAGDVDAGWVPSRAFAAAGISGFDVLDAPFVITSYDAEAAVVEPNVAEPFLDRLKGSGILGLTLAAGGLRRPVSVGTPLLGVPDWAGRKVVVQSEQQGDVVKALGAEPVQSPSLTTSQGVAFASGAVTATEFDVAKYDSEAMGTSAPYISGNVVLWPKVWVFIVNEQRFRALPGAQQQWLLSAATDARHASIDGSHDEATPASHSCSTFGARMPRSSASEITAMHEAVAPMLEKMAQDPVAGPLLSLIRATVAPFAPEAELDVALPCQGASAPGPGRDVGTVPSTRSDLPPGTYRITLTIADLRAAGVGEDRLTGNDGILTLIVKPNGTYEQWLDDIPQPNDGARPHMMWEVGEVRGSGDRVYFVPSLDELVALKAKGVVTACCDPGNGLQTTPYSVVWAAASDSEVTFTDLAGIEDPIAQLWMVVNPYERIG